MKYCSIVTVHPYSLVFGSTLRLISRSWYVFWMSLHRSLESLRGHVTRKVWTEDLIGLRTPLIIITSSLRNWMWFYVSVLEVSTLGLKR